MMQSAWLSYRLFACAFNRSGEAEIGLLAGLLSASSAEFELTICVAVALPDSRRTKACR